MCGLTWEPYSYTYTCIYDMEKQRSYDWCYFSGWPLPMQRNPTHAHMHIQHGEALCWCWCYLSRIWWFIYVDCKNYCECELIFNALRSAQKMMSNMVGLLLWRTLNNQLLTTTYKIQICKVQTILLHLVFAGYGPFKVKLRLTCSAHAQTLWCGGLLPFMVLYIVNMEL